MTGHDERQTTSQPRPDRSQDFVPSMDADESGALAIGLMTAVVAMVALLTLALLISIP